MKGYPRWLAWLLRLLQRRCPHAAMKADLLEGDVSGFAVRWCESCGAVSVDRNGNRREPRMPEPTWEAA